jgi:hypothetical protein
MSKDFREIEKEHLQIMVPIDLATKVRERAGRERASLSKFGTEALSRHMGIDPATYGIEAEQKSA